MGTFNTTQFTVDRGRKTFIADITDLPYKGAALFDRLYNDACDAGFTFISSRTGHRSKWYFSCTGHDAEGELQGWTFLPDSQSIRNHPQLKDWKVVVIND